MGHGLNGSNGLGRIFFVGREPTYVKFALISPSAIKQKNPSLSVQSVRSVFPSTIEGKINLQTATKPQNANTDKASDSPPPDSKNHQRKSHTYSPSLRKVETS